MAIDHQLILFSILSQLAIAKGSLVLVRRHGLLRVNVIKRSQCWGTLLPNSGLFLLISLLDVVFFVLHVKLFLLVGYGRVLWSHPL